MNLPQLVPALPASQSVVRPQDLLVLRFAFVNLRLVNRRGALLLTRADAALPAWLDVHYPPQSIAEAAFPETSGPPVPVHPPVPWRLAQPSRLRFGVPADEAIEYSLAGLLAACQRLPPRLMPTATFEPGAGVGGGGLALLPLIGNPAGEGNAAFTYVEAPYGLFLSPGSAGKWVHAAGPVTSYVSEWTELWHSRLRHAVAGRLPTVRAIWARGYAALQTGAPAPADPDFDGALTPRQRFEIVERTSNFKPQVPPVPPGAPSPVTVNALALSALGAWLDVHGNWENDGPSTLLLEWRHQATQGRDHYVRVVEQGFLWPFGHRAALVTVTERKFETEERPLEGVFTAATPTEKHRVAVLRRRQYLVVREPRRQYPAQEQPAGKAHQVPFQQVRLTTRVTPALDQPSAPLVAGVPAAEAFYPQVNQQDFLFHVEMTDAEGQRVDFSLPLAFIMAKRAYQPAFLEGLAKAKIAAGRRRAGLRQQEFAFAAPLPGLPGNTTLETQSLEFDAAPVPQLLAALQASGQPPFCPIIKTFAAAVPALKQLAGEKSVVEMELAPANAGDVFARLTGPKLNLAFATAQLGGLIKPDFSVEGLSKKLGAVGDVANLMAGKADLQQLFGAGGGLALPRLFGLIELKDVLRLDGTLADVPQLLRTKLPEALQTKLHWETPLREWNGVFKPLPGNGLLLDGTFTVPLSPEGLPAPGQSKFEVRSQLSNFALNFLGVIELQFNSIEFVAQTGKKVDLAANLRKLEFQGPLRFLDKLREVIPLQGFIDPPNLDVTTEGITAGYTLALPTVGVGAFALQNLSVGAAFSLPLLDLRSPSVRFAFGERQSPFLITVTIFAGGGFFGLAVSPEGVETLEASLEFGGNIALNLGVASGGVYVLAGIYFRYELAGGGTVLEGYLRCGGALRVLGLVTVSVEFYMGLGYQDDKAVGRATVKVKVKVLFFSKSVSLSTERRFSGSTGDPFFEQTTTPAAWSS